MNKKITNPDYPQNRGIAMSLTNQDRKLIMHTLHLSYGLVSKWCKGERNNRFVMEMAKIMSIHNQNKIEEIELLTSTDEFQEYIIKRKSKTTKS